MLNLIFYLGCVLVLLKGVELFIAALRDPPGSGVKKLGIFAGLVGIAGAILLLMAGERVADLEREPALPAASEG